MAVSLKSPFDLQIISQNTEDIIKMQYVNFFM